MYSLQSNSEVLQEVFGEFHAAVSAKQIPDRRIYYNCVIECHATNEIAGLQFLQLQRTRLINPVFVAGSIDHSILLREITGERYAQLVESVCEQEGYMEFGAHKHWHKDHLLFLEEISTFDDPVKILEQASLLALSVLKHYDHCVAMVCGPVSSATEPFEESLKRFSRAVLGVGKHPLPVFSQLPFEGLFQKVHELLDTSHEQLVSCSNDTSCEEKEEEKSKFFMELFHERIIKDANKEWIPYFMHGWRKCSRTRLEHNLFELLKFSPVDLEKKFGLLN